MQLREFARNRVAGLALLSLPWAIQAMAAPKPYTYTGGASDPANWHNETNWATGGTTNGYPGQVVEESEATIPDGKSPVFTSGPVNNLYRLTTGNGTVVFSASVSCHDASPYGPFITVGSGGMVVTGDVYTSRGSFTANGNVKITGALRVWQGNIVQNAGAFEIGGTIFLPDQSSSTIGPWVFASAYTATVAHATIVGTHTFTWSGTPNYAGGRPNYEFYKGGDGGTHYYVGTNTLLGHTLLLDGWPGGPGRFSILRCGGGALDLYACCIAYGYGGSGTTYLTLTNSTVQIRGTGAVSLAAWYNRSTNNFAFDARTGTTVTFDPDGVATQYVDTGSRDRDSYLLNPADWKNNFAFHTVRIGAGDTVTLVGNANIEGGGVSALYATQLIGLGAGSTLRLNGHNVYLLRRATGVTFDTTGGGRVFQLGSGTVIMIH